MSVATIEVPEGLRRLNDVYAAAGHELWFVGGCVRDAIMGMKAKDVDLATSATPDEQVALCDAAGLRWFGTGLQHGTLTVLVDEEPYEITTFRTDVETDGRHAVVAWTPDIETDLARRDLTVNAIAMAFDGRIVDPFDGVKDALERRVRFVGDAATRIREDHLRILRWFRFLGRFGDGVDFVTTDLDAIRTGAPLLRSISVERVWSEMQRIIVGPQAYGIVRTMSDFEVLDAIGVGRGSLEMLAAAGRHSSDPALVLAAWQGDHAPGVLDRWKASTAERGTASFAAPRLHGRYELDDAKLDLVDGADLGLVLSILRTRDQGHLAEILREWTIPTFPLQGRDLIAAGMTPGKGVGDRLRALRDRWIASDFALDRDQLLADMEVAA